MADSYDRYDSEGGGGGFMMGLLTGTVLGAGLGMLLAPKAGAELRGQLGEQARNLGNAASEQYRKATESASGWADKGREMMNQARDAVSRGAEEARGYAGASGSGSYSSGTTGSSYESSGTTGSGGSSFGSPGASSSPTGDRDRGDFGRS